MHALADPYPFYKRLRSTDPVHRVGASAFYLVSTWALVTEAVARPGHFSSNLTATMVCHPDGGVSAFDFDDPGAAGHVLATADDPVHAVHRKMVLPPLIARRIRALEPFIAATAQRLWAEGRGDGHIDWIGAVADRLPMTVVSQLIGLPEDDIDRLVRWAYASTQMLDGAVGSDQLAAAVVAAADLAAYLADQFARARAHPRDDLLGVLAARCNAGDIAADTAVLILIQLVGAGGESTAGLLGNAAWLLATRPGAAACLRKEPGLVPAFIEEVLRLESPFRGHYRHVLCDTTLGGVALPAGSHLLLLWGSANRDPAAFDNPDELRLDRPNARCHIAFGKADHFCVGAALARLEARIALRMLLAETTAVAATDPPDWVPSIMVRRLRHLELEFRP